MENKNYLIIQDNMVTNIVLWNGDTEQWKPPGDSLVLLQEATPSFNWQYVSDLDDFGLVETLGGAVIGDKWTGTACVTTQEKPPKPEPISSPAPAIGDIPTSTL